jgi:hypothetical protein
MKRRKKKNAAAVVVAVRTTNGKRSRKANSGTKAGAKKRKARAARARSDERARKRLEKIERNPERGKRGKRRRSSKKNPGEQYIEFRSLYRKLHWGAVGKDDIEAYDVPDARGPLAVLGRLRLVEYDTKKGSDPRMVTWVHKFVHSCWLLVNGAGDLLVGTKPGEPRYRVERAGIVG